MNYWNNLSDRERWLLGTAGSLLFLLAVFFLVMRPVVGAKTRAERAQVNAQKELTLVKQGLPFLSGGTTSVTGSQPFDRNSVMKVVQSSGLEMSRIQPENDGALKVWFEEATSAKVLQFISDTTSTYAATISAAQINRQQNGLVNATITLRPVGG